MKVITSRALIAAAVAAVALSLPAAAEAQFQGQIVLRRGEPTGVGGTLALPGFVRTNNSGGWFVASATSSDGPTQVSYLNGNLFAYTGQDIGLSDASFGSISIAGHLNNHGDVAYNASLSGSPTATNSGMFFKQNMFLRKGVDTVPNPPFSPDVTYSGFFGGPVAINDNRQVLNIVSFDDPTIASTVDRGLFIYNLDASGNLLSTTVVSHEGATLTGSGGATWTVADFQTSQGTSGFNNSGDVIYMPSLTGGGPSGALYLNGTLLAENGGDSPIAGRPWATSAFGSSARAAINNSGDHAYRALIDATGTDNRNLIVKNGVKFVQQGDEAPGFAGSSITGFGTGSLYIDDNGDILWYAAWTNADATTSEGLFLGSTLVLGIGDVIEGETVTDISSVANAYHLSNNGGYVIAKVRTDGSTTDNRVVLIAIPEPASLGLLGLAGLTLLRRRR